MRYFIIAGEDSGDLHGSDLIEAILRQDPKAEILGMGGDRMEKAGMQLWKHYRELAIMGISDVLRNMRLIRHTLRACRSAIESFRPERLVLIDYGGFNLRIAQWARGKGYRIDYYILPKVWAWNERRIHRIRRYTDFAYVIFPFEESYFREHGVQAYYVGNPVREQIAKFRILQPERQVVQGQIALLPGSRKAEIGHILPVFLQTATLLRDRFTFILALNGNAKEWLKHFEIPENVEVVYNNSYQVLNSCEMALVTSGTATLETALLGVPQVVCYRTTRLNYALGKRFIRVPYLSPVNLILGREAIPERIQKQCNAQQLAADIETTLLSGNGEQQRSIADLDVILGTDPASTQTALRIIRAHTHENMDI